MAKKAGAASSGTRARKVAKPSAKAKAGASKARAKPRKAASSSRGSGDTAVDALLKLLESPLVADLLAVGATAALASISETRHSRRTGADGKSSQAAKTAAKAAAAAIGRRLSAEFEEIKKAAKKV